jgi:hypothetical protein
MFNPSSPQPCFVSIEPLHMYCKTLRYEDAQGQHSVVVEFDVYGDVLLWELDILADEARRKEVIENIESFFAKGPRKLRVAWAQAR